MLKKYILPGLLLLVFYAGRSQPEQKSILPGADQTQSYIPILKGKRVAMVANPTSMISGTPTVDSLLHSGIKIVKVFGPEHGFRGLASNGAIVSDARDPATGIPIISLYGRKSKPSREDLQD